MLNKVPGLGKGLRLQRTMLDLSFSETFKGERIPDAYERLLLEAMRGNQALFIRRDEVEQAWTWVDSIQNAWQEQYEPPKAYAAGSWGPAPRWPCSPVTAGSGMSSKDAVTATR